MAEKIKIDNGGYAFPGKIEVDTTPHSKTYTPGDICMPGMTLRDYLASQIAIAMINHPVNQVAVGVGNEHNLDYIANNCYEMADALIRRKRKDE